MSQACSFMSLYAVSFFVWAAHKNFAVLVFPTILTPHPLIVVSTFFLTTWMPYHNWFHWFFQFIDLADSMFFVARKKFTHLSPLHVIHHGTLPLLCWWGPRWQIGSLLSWFILLTWTISGLLEEVRVALVPSLTLVCTWWCTSTTSLQPVAHPSKSEG